MGGGGGGEISSSENSSSSDSENSKDNSISSESEQSDSPVGSQSFSPIKDREKDTGYVHFEVEEGADKTETLRKDMSDYLSKKFNVFIPDKCLKEKILDKYPLKGHLYFAADDNLKFC